MGRRRLALRQVEERADPDVSDLESDQELAADAAAPNFSLLLAPAAPPSAVDHQQHQHLGDDSDQVIAPTAPSVFKLYQDGLTPEQPLQLAFLRRRAPRALRDARVKIQDEFVVPQPPLELSDVLPPLDVDLSRLVVAKTAETADVYHYASTDVSHAALQSAIASATRFFHCPQQATANEVEQWTILSESDWLEVYHTSQLRHPDASLPSLPAVTSLLEQCPSASLVQFVWSELLVSLIDSGFNSGDAGYDIHIHDLLTLLVHHPSVSRLAPKEFRKRVRAADLRQVDDALGARLELELVALFMQQHRRRQSTSSC